VHFSYQRFLENRIRDAFHFEGSPLRLIFRERSRVELEPRKRRVGAPSKGRSGAAGRASGTGRPAGAAASRVSRKPVRGGGKGGSGKGGSGKGGTTGGPKGGTRS